MNFESNNWSSQIEQYKNGTLTAEARYQLEKAALDDEFLFDALEGYSLYSNSTGSSKTDSEAKPGARTKANIFSLRNMAVAASLILLVGVVGYLKTNVNKDNNTYADAEAAASEQAPPSITMNKEVSVVDAMEKGDDVAAVPKEPQSEAVSKTKLTNQEPKIKKSNEVVKKPAIDGVAISTNSVEEEELLEDAIQEEAALAIRSETKETLSEAPTATKNRSVLQSERPGLLADQDLTSSKTKQSLTMNSAPIEGNNIGQLATPEGGWKAFESYISKNKKNITLLKPATITVKFTVGTNGQVSNIKALPSSCSGCAAEAIRLVGKYGNWETKTGKAQEVEYRIKF